jgi:hypothetical protein
VAVEEVTQYPLLVRLEVLGAVLLAGVQRDQVLVGKGITVEL